MSVIEVIDISPWVRPSDYSDSDRDQVVYQWDRAFSQVGFTAITGDEANESSLASSLTIT